MKKAGRCSAIWVCRTGSSPGSRTQWRNNGKEIPDSESDKKAEIQGPNVSSVPAVREVPGISEEVRYVQDMFQEPCAQGGNTRSDQGKLVIKGARINDDRSDSGYANTHPQCQ